MCANAGLRSGSRVGDCRLDGIDICGLPDLLSHTSLVCDTSSCGACAGGCGGGGVTSFVVVGLDEVLRLLDITSGLRYARRLDTCAGSGGAVLVKSDLCGAVLARAF